MDTPRQAIIEELEHRFEPFTDRLNDALRDWRFTFAEQKATHLMRLDPALVARHALPYCISEETYFGLDEQGVRFFAAVILLHSLALRGWMIITIAASAAKNQRWTPSHIA